MVEFDAVLSEVGEMSSYQLTVVLLLLAPTSLLNAFGRFLYIFQFYTPDFCCRSFDDRCDPANVTYSSVISDQCVLWPDGSNGSSSGREPHYCSEWRYDRSYFDSTAVTDWSLVCYRMMYGTWVLTAAIAVSVVGSFPFSFVQDKFGRRFCFLMCLVFYIVGHVSSLFSPNIWWFLALRSVSSLVTLSLYSSAVIWALEFVGTSKRLLVTCLLPIFYGVASCVLALLAWMCNDWVKLGLATSLPFVLLFVYPLFVYESPHWLFVTNRKEKAAEVLAKIACSQGKVFDRDLVLKASTSDVDKDEKKGPEDAPRTGKLIHLLVDGNTCSKVIAMTTIMTSIVIGYNAINFNVENLASTNLYISFGSQSIMETFSGLSLIFVLEKVGRTRSLFCTLVLAGLSILLMQVVGAYSSVLLLVFQAMAKYFVGCSYSTAELLVNELLPTQYRAVGFGFTQSLSELCTVAVPFLLYAGQSNQYLLTTVSGSLFIICALLVLAVPETKGRPLPETIDDCRENGEVSLATMTTTVASAVKRLKTLWTKAGHHTNVYDLPEAAASSVDLRRRKNSLPSRCSVQLTLQHFN